MVFAEGRKYGCGDFAGQHDVVYRRSTDRGKSFSKLQVLMDPAKMFGESQCPAANRSTETGSCEFWDPTPFADAMTGDVHFITTRSWAHAGVNNEGSRMEGLMDCWLVSSTDLVRQLCPCSTEKCHCYLPEKSRHCCHRGSPGAHPATLRAKFGARRGI